MSFMLYCLPVGRGTEDRKTHGGQCRYISVFQLDPFLARDSFSTVCG